MGRARSGALLGLTVSCVVLVFSSSNCAEATQIIVEVRAESSLCSSKEGIETGIAVSTVDHIDDEELEVFQSGCTGDQLVGKLTITPSGSKDAEVGIRIVAGVGIPAADCHGPKWEHCILARRKVHFTRRTANYLAVYLSSACIGKACGDKECDRGACVDPNTIANDGGKIEPDDASSNVTDADLDDGSFALDAGEDACSLCTGTGKTCDGKTCTVDCSVVNCRNKTLCPPQIDCAYQCDSLGACIGTQCGGGTGSCTFACSATGACSDISCPRGKCSVTCENAMLACNSVSLDGGTNSVRCRGGGEVTCDDVNCSGKTCERTCGLARAACGPQGACSSASNCTNWMDGG